MSVLTYGFEAWKLDGRVVGMLGSWNAKRLALITGREIRAEQAVPTFGLVDWLRARRLQWAGHLLRCKDRENLAARVARVELRRHCEAGGSFGLFMDAPALSEEEVLGVAANRDLWRGLVERAYVYKLRK